MYSFQFLVIVLNLIIKYLNGTIILYYIYYYITTYTNVK